MKILDRINELANKEKVQPLTVAEKQRNNMHCVLILCKHDPRTSINNIFHNKSGRSDRSGCHTRQSL